ncbi:hypothetical protein J2S49_000983 [Arcanobacterium wilhelmae]|uniref:Uncharacterized protein n=1 Tax=Arcanobacterium wilhelmae TaxID=1803177 RepID=A0ABT9NB09_9ACTO|nr:hypothetical protein [Arcanobacterium wilhelmae]
MAKTSLGLRENALKLVSPRIDVSRETDRCSAAMLHDLMSTMRVSIHSIFLRISLNLVNSRSRRGDERCVFVVGAPPS